MLILMFTTFFPSGIMISVLLEPTARTIIILLNVLIGLLVIMSVLYILVLIWQSSSGSTHYFIIYYCDTGYIGTSSHVHSDEGMNDLLFNAIPLKNVLNKEKRYLLNQIKSMLRRNSNSLSIHLPRRKRRHWWRSNPNIPALLLVSSLSEMNYMVVPMLRILKINKALLTSSPLSKQFVIPFVILTLLKLIKLKLLQSLRNYKMRVCLNFMLLLLLSLL